ncbi:hypothetical protein DWV76_07525 [Segatella copri]|uniref:Uncharacterized protein n=1 Tax=Segatella copri TaxID=165179 RepID=A0AA92V9V0_9BACT|nr:hypothetical protein DWV76_07525 [Segatella copri]RHL34645.1 hypothetical protein DW026_12630 [Segatella copri]
MQLNIADIIVLLIIFFIRLTFLLIIKLWVQIYKINLKRTLSYVTKTFPILSSVRLTIQFLF